MERRELFGFLSSSVKEAVREKKDDEVVLRPPYYSDIDAFATECQNCEGECASLCQEQIIVIAEDKTPHLVFNSRGCTYCDECAIACPSDVLLVASSRFRLLFFGKKCRGTRPAEHQCISIGHGVPRFARAFQKPEIPHRLQQERLQQPACFPEQFRAFDDRANGGREPDGHLSF